jgi:hypothetical protein
MAGIRAFFQPGTWGSHQGSSTMVQEVCQCTSKSHRHLMLYHTRHFSTAAKLTTEPCITANGWTGHQSVMPTGDDCGKLIRAYWERLFQRHSLHG